MGSKISTNQFMRTHGTPSRQKTATKTSWANQRDGYCTYNGNNGAVNAACGNAFFDCFVNVQNLYNLSEVMSIPLYNKIPRLTFSKHSAFDMAHPFPWIHILTTGHQNLSISVGCKQRLGFLLISPTFQVLVHASAVRSAMPSVVIFHTLSIFSRAATKLL